jgi:hypothetical protein
LEALKSKRAACLKADITYEHVEALPAIHLYSLQAVGRSDAQRHRNIGSMSYPLRE